MEVVASMDFERPPMMKIPHRKTTRSVNGSCEIGPMRKARYYLLLFLYTHMRLLIPYPLFAYANQPRLASLVDTIRDGCEKQLLLAC
jgi:hypothetical protein